MRFPKKTILPAALRLAVPLALWFAFFGALAPRFQTHIPYSARISDRETQVRGRPFPGDHIQLLYHFWLTKTKLSAKTPPFSNVYEFNLGDDSARREFDPGYLPFSLVYSAVAGSGLSHAAAWNLAQLAAILTAYLFLFLLASRYSASRATAHFAAALAMCVPYQWINLAGGSPTGFGMAFVPGVALGIDIAVRDGKTRGGALAGIALLFCWTSDLHCLAFALMLAPAWVLIAALRSDISPQNRAELKNEIVNLLRALWPLMLSGIIVLGVAMWLASFYAKTDAAGGRSIDDLARNSPIWQALRGVVLRPGADANAYVGPVVWIAVPLSLFAFATDLALKRNRRKSAGGILLCAGIVFVIFLALGTNGPLEGLALRVMRKLAPPYKMIRQPLKVFCLLPTLLAPIIAIGLANLRGENGRNAGIRSAAFRTTRIALAAAVIICVRKELRLAVCLIPDGNAVYAAVRAESEKPNVLCIPIWPGDSAWSSLYQLNTMLEDVRMANGYSAVCTADYLRGAYSVFEPVTQGLVGEKQLAAFREYGITDILLYADAFPEKVSPFPIGTTIARLMANPNLRYVENRNSRIFRFKTNGEPGTPGDFGAPRFVSPARRWSSIAGTFNAAGIDPANAVAHTRSPVFITDDLAWQVRLRETPSAPASVAEWRRFPVRVPENAAPDWSVISFVAAEECPGAEVLDILLTLGDIPLGRDEIELWPATHFFTGGIPVFGDSVLGNSLIFKSGEDSTDESFYGFGLPLDEGKWDIEVTWADISDDEVPPHESAGTFYVIAEGEILAQEEVARNAETRHGWNTIRVCTFETAGSPPITLRFQYAGKNTIIFGNVNLKKSE